MIKIGLVIGQLTIGGAEKQLVLLAKGLKKTGLYEPIVFCLSHNTEPNGRLLSEEMVEWHEIPARINNYLSKALWLQKQTKKAHIPLLYGILHVGNVYTAIAGLINQMPFICSIRNADINLSWWINILSRWSCNQANFIIANSQSCAKSLVDDLKISNSNFGVIENAIEFHLGDGNGRQVLMSNWGFPQDAIVIGTISNLKKQKNPSFFIDVFKYISLLHENNIYFVWIGDGPQRQHVINSLSNLDENLREKIIFPGARIDISNVLQSFDIFILTSMYEGMPNALMEAMAVGLPCLATDVDGTKDLITKAKDGNEIGILASSTDATEFAKTLDGLLSDPLRMKKMGNNAQKHMLDHFSLEKMVLAHCKVFDDVLTNN